MRLKLGCLGIIALLQASCGSTSEPEQPQPAPNEDRLEASRGVWLQRKADIYTYAVEREYQSNSTSEALNGRWKTVIAVEKDVVICRRFQDFDQQNNLRRDYLELGEEVGNHNFGWRAVTFDQLYADCKEIINEPNVTLKFYELSPLLGVCSKPRKESDNLMLSQGRDDRIEINELLLGKDLCSPATESGEITR